MSSNTGDASIITLKRVYDEYGLCAGRLRDLQNELTKGED